MSGYTWYYLLLSLSTFLPLHLSSETVSWGQSVTGLLRAKRKNTEKSSSSSSPSLPAIRLPFHIWLRDDLRIWETELSASFLIRKTWRSLEPKSTVTKIRPNSTKPLAWKKLKGSLFLPPLLTDLCGIKIVIWTYRQLHVDQKYECNKILHSKPRFWILLSGPLI